jgi:hypothetical protein
MGKGSQQQTVPAGGTTRTVSLPEYADPYFRRLLKGAEEATQPFYPDDPDTYGDLAGESTYVPYGGERIAGSEDYGDIGTSRAMVRGIAESPIGGLGEAAELQRRGIAGLEGLANYNTAAFDPYTGFQAGRADPYSGFQAGSADPFAGFNESQFQAQRASEFGFDPARQFTGAEVQQYMDPYMQNVVDVQKREAREDFGRSQAARDAGAVTAGAFGGSRQAVQQGMAEEGLREQLGDIQAAGSQAAFQQAMKAFESDRAAQMDVDARRAAEAARVQGIDIGEVARTEASSAAEAARTQQARASELARTQGISLDEAARVQSAEAAELARTQGISLDEAARIQNAEAAERARVQSSREASRQFGAGQGLAAYQAALAAGRGLVDYGERARAADIQGAQLLETVGRDIRSEDQARLDLAYQDFLRQQDYPMRQYERFAAMLSGVPIQPDISTATYQAYNPIQQALGTGISALGLYKGLAG